MESKLNIGLAISKNFNKVTIEFVDEVVEYESEEILKARIRQKLKLIREEVDLEFSKMVK